MLGIPTWTAMLKGSDNKAECQRCGNDAEVSDDDGEYCAYCWNELTEPLV